MALDNISITGYNPGAVRDEALKAFDERKKGKFDMQRQQYLDAENARRYQAEQSQHSDDAFQEAYTNVVKGVHTGQLTPEEGMAILRMHGAQRLGAGAPQPQGMPQQAPAQPPVNPLLRAAQAQQPPQTQAPAGPSPLDALNAAITAKTLDPRQAGPTQPPMMPTPGVSSPPSPMQVGPMQPPAPQPEAPQNPLLRAAQAGQQQDAARAGALKFRRNGQEYSVASRDEMLAAQKHEKDAQIQEQLAQFDKALAENPDDPYLKKNAPTFRAMIRSGEDPSAKDMFGVMRTEESQDAQDKRKQMGLDATRQNLLDILEPGRNKRALISAGSNKYKADSMNEAMHYMADKRAELGGENNEIKRESQGNTELNSYLRNTKFSGQVQSGRRLREAARLAAAQGDNTAMAQHEALVELVSRANGGASVTQGKMDYLVGSMAGKMDKIAQAYQAMKDGKLSQEQEAGLLKTVQLGSEAYDHERGVLDEGVKKLLNHHKMDPVRKNDLYHAYMQSLGEDANPDPFPTSPEAAPQNPLQRAAAAGKAKDKAGAAQLGGVVERVVTNPERAKELGVPVGSKVKVRKTNGGWEVVQ